MIPYRRPSPEAVLASFRRPQPATETPQPLRPGDAVIVSLRDGEVTGEYVGVDGRALLMVRVRFMSGLWAGSTGAVEASRVRRA